MHGWVRVLTSVASNMISHVIVVLVALLAALRSGAALVPSGTTPRPAPAFVDDQPVASTVDTIRALFARQPARSGIRTALATATHHRKIA